MRTLFDAFFSALSEAGNSIWERRLSLRSIARTVERGAPFAMLIVLIAVVGVAFSTVPTANTVVLPIRVIPADGVSSHTESVVLNTGAPSSVDRLYVQAHQPSYHVGGTEQGEWEGFDVEGAVSIRINGGSWVDVRDENVTCAFPEREYGCVGGGPPNLRFSIPVSNAASENTIEFRFNGTDGVRSGFRVLRVGLMSGADDLESFNPNSDGVHTTNFTYEDYSQWTAPDGYGSSADIQAGQDLFTSRDILVDRITGTAEPITAACNDCHALNGLDLKYFNYSNESIVARSRFHGLSTEQGKQIAAFIRSITLRHEDGTTYEAPGTPWDPPFQPGHTSLASGKKLTETHPDLVSAGAGLDDVLNRDEEMLPYIFPKNGDPANGVDTFMDPSTGNTQLRWKHIRFNKGPLPVIDWPISIQFADWNNWLPDIAPVDHPTYDFEETTYFGGENAWLTYKFLVGNPRTGEYDGELDARNLSSAQGRQWTSDDFRKFGEQIRSARRDTDWGTALLAKARLLIQQWGAVRMWEIHQHYNLFGKGDDGFEGQDYDDWSLSFGFWPRSRILFDMAPHIVGGNESDPFPYGTRMKSKYYTHVWYHLQTLIAPGVHPNFGGQGPVDWQYQAPHLRELSAVTGVGGGLRQLQGELVRWERFYNPDLTTGVGLSGGDYAHGRRWNARHTTPLHWMGCPFEPDGKCQETYGNLDPTLKSQVVTAAMRAWWEAQSSIPLTDYQAWQCDKQGKCWEPASHVPDPGSYVWSHVYADRYYQEIPMMRDGGVAAGVLDSITTWAGNMWPEGNDESVMGTNPTWKELVDYSPPETLTQNIPVDAGWNLISSRVAPSNDSMHVILENANEDIAIVQSENGEAYDPTRSDNSLDTWDPSQGYRVYANSQRTITVDGKVLSSPTYELKQGWNLIPFFPSTEMPVSDAFASISDKIEIVKNEKGDSYIPSRSLDEIGMLKPGRAYKVYLNEAASFSYP